MLSDLRYALRSLSRSPGFAITAILTLALGIGANGAVAGLLNAVMLRPIPGLGDPGQLVWISTQGGGIRSGLMSYPDYLDYRDGNRVMAGMAAYLTAPLSLGSGGEPARVDGEVVSANYFGVLGVAPALGRGFVPDEDEAPLARPVAVVSDRLWRERFAGGTGIIGSQVVINGRQFTVVGVAPAGFRGTELERPADLWVPAMMLPAAMPGSPALLTKRGAFSFRVIGRLATGATVDQAERALRTIARRIEAEHPESRRDELRGLTVGVAPVGGWVQLSAAGDALPLIVLSFTVTALVMLIAGSNVANLLLVRAAVRRREIGIRLAIGASRGRIVRQLLVESVLLAGIAGVLGLLLSFWATDLGVAFLAPPFALDLSPSVPVLAFTIGLSLLIGAGFGLAPALRASRPELLPALKNEALTAGGTRRSRLQGGFVVAQIALSLVLLVSAGLFLRSLRNAGTVNVGFDADPVLAVSLDAQLQGYAPAEVQAFHARLLERVRALPGVQAASLSSNVPFSSTMVGTSMYAEDPRARGETMPRHIFFQAVWPDYFRTLGMPVLRGRDVAPTDGPSAPPVAVVSEQLARAVWPGESALGKRVSIQGASGPFMEVIGVVKDGQYDELGERPKAYLYVPAAQESGVLPGMTLLVRATDPAVLAPAIKREVRAMDASLPLYRITTMRALVDEKVRERAKGATLISAFAGIALLLAALGLYGVMAYTVTQRTREIGVRVALGARQRDVLTLVVGDGARLAVAGVLVGVVLAVGVTRLIGAMLIGVRPYDPLTFAAVSAVLATVALLASWLPARRASRVDPMVALRYE
jgi:predicted permease